MTRSKTWYPVIRSILPPDEPMAPFMARLFVLWQDLLFEHHGIVADGGFQEMDLRGGNDLARRLYFIRGNSRTLTSAKVLFDALGGEATFRQWLGENTEMESAYRNAIGVFNQHRRAFEKIRDTVGAHAERDLGDALRFLGIGEQGRFEIHSEDVMRPGIATNILLAALSRSLESEPSERLEAYRRAITPLATATEAMIRAMSIIAHVYMTKVEVLPP